MEKGQRIAKVIAAAGLASRRGAEQLIAQGLVTVNGKTIDTPATLVTPTDKITVDGRVLPQAQKSRLFMYHKPRGCLCTNHDPEGRTTVFDLLPRDFPRVLTIGRLDYNTEGLLLLTTDGDLAQKLMRSELPRTYRVRFNGRLDDAAQDAIRKGLTIDGFRYKPAQIEVTKSVTLTEGKNREIRNMFEHFSCEVSRLMRLSYGPFKLGEIPTKGFVEVPPHILKEFYSTLGK
jgi:23S rRNA pseudouridine2605 synthase